MAKFLTRAELYRVLQRELPEGVYADGPATAFFTTADMDSVAKVVESGYTNLQRIYDNFFPQTADEKIGDWITKMFVGVSFDTGVTLQEKRDRVIAKIRKQPTIALWEVLKLIAGYIPPGKYVQIVENCHGEGAWALGLSELGINTILGYNHHFGDLGIDVADWCPAISNRGWVLGVSQLGIDTELDQYGYLGILEPQLQAYSYDIRIFETEVTGTSYAQMVRAINETEPARSVHFITQNLNLSDFHLTNPVNDVDEFSLVNCITQDSGSDTGYSGLTT